MEHPRPEFRFEVYTYGASSLVRCVDTISGTVRSTVVCPSTQSKIEDGKLEMQAAVEHDALMKLDKSVLKRLE